MAIADVSTRGLSELTSLKGRVAVITGGARGLGRAISQRLAEAGAHVFVADINGQSAQDAAEEMMQKGRKASWAQVDATESTAMSALADRVVKESGRLDIWVNNAGVYPIDDTLTMTDARWQKVLDLNLSGTFFGAREAAKRMQVVGNGGVIVNMASSVAYRVGQMGFAHYAASKSGVVGLTKSLAFDLAPHNIRVLAVAPALMGTEGLQEARPVMEQSMGGRDIFEAFAEMLPVKRVGVPDDVARVVLFCASDLSMFMTGSALLVDGGMMTA